MFITAQSKGACCTLGLLCCGNSVSGIALYPSFSPFSNDRRRWFLCWVVMCARRLKSGQRISSAGDDVHLATSWILTPSTCGPHPHSSFLGTIKHICTIRLPSTHTHTQAVLLSMPSVSLALVSLARICFMSGITNHRRFVIVLAWPMA